MATKEKARQGTAGDGREKVDSKKKSSKLPASSQVKNNALLAAALELAAHGLVVFPVAPGGKVPPDKSISNLCDAPRCRICPEYAGAAAENPCSLGKGGGLKVATTKPAIIKKWWAREPRANVALALGASGRVVIDCDTPAGVAAYVNFCEAYDIPLDNTPTINTPGTLGRHYHYLVGEHADALSKIGSRGIIFNADGNPIVEILTGEHAAMLPPSYFRGTRKTKTQKAKLSGFYKWRLDRNFDVGNAGPVPPAVVALAATNAGETPGQRLPPANGAEATTTTIPEGKRDTALTALAGVMRRKGLTAVEMLPTLREVNNRCKPPLTEADLVRIASSVERYPPAEEYALTDTGNAECFERLYDGQVKYDHARDRWLIKDTHFWAVDKTDQVNELAVAAVRKLHHTAVDINDAQRKTKTIAHAVQSENEPRLRRLLDCAKSKPAIKDTGEGWDARPELVGTPLGIVDLRTGDLRDGAADDKITRVIEHYDPTAKAPRWKHFLNEIFPNNPPFQEYIQMAVGYSLTGYTSEKCFFFCYGPTNTGKTTFLEAILTAFGEYGDTAPFETFVAGKHGRREGPSPFMVAMAERRFIKSMEPPTRSGRNTVTFNEGMIKEITGRDTIKIRDLWGKPVSIKVMYHVWFGANEKPDIRAEAEPVWDRIKTIPFSRTFAGDAMDISLDEKLAAEKAGITNYAIEGAVKWWIASAQGTRRVLHDNVPAEIREATATWRSENDLFAQFLADECITGEGKEVTNAALCEVYRKWWAGQGLSQTDDPRLLSARSIGHRLAREDYEKGKDRRGARCWRGIGLKTAYTNKELGLPDPKDEEPAEF